jgi:xanthine dehydrogenase accessory factor
VVAAHALEPAYLGVMASRRRYAHLRAALEARLPAGAVDAISCPAGLDIGARAPEEVAVSVLAEIVQHQRRRAGPAALPLLGSAAPRTERDPVCGMDVIVSPAAHHADVGGRTYYFCCGGCEARFRRHPERFLAMEETTP